MAGKRWVICCGRHVGLLIVASNRRVIARGWYVWLLFVVVILGFWLQRVRWDIGCRKHVGLLVVEVKLGYWLSRIRLVIDRGGHVGLMVMAEFEIIGKTNQTNRFAN